MRYYAMAIVAVTALCTFLTRIAPFLIFGQKGEPSPVIKFLGKALPPAVMAILVVYCVKSVNIFVPAQIVPTAVSIAVVVLLHVWKRNNLLSIIVGTICYMVFVQVVF